MRLIVLLFIIIMAFPLYFVSRTNRKIEEGVILSILGIPIVMYFIDIFINLRFAVYIIVFLSVLFYVLAFYNIIKQKKINIIFKQIITPAFIIWTLAYMGLFLFHKGRLFIGNDEFSHWGNVIRTMFNLNDFGTNSDSLLIFKSYPPGIALFQVFIEYINGFFSEWIAYFGIHIIYITLFLPFFKKLSFKNIKSILLSVVLMIMLPLIFTNNFYTTLTVDAILGIVFGFSIAYVMSIKNYDKYDFVLLSFVSFLLVLIKDAGFFLALISFIIIFIGLNIQDKSYLLIIKKTKRYIKSILPALVILLVILSTYFSWQIIIKSNNVEKIFGNKIEIKEVIDLIEGKEISYKSEVIANYREALVHQNVTNLSENNFTYSFFMFLIIVFFVLLYFELIDKKNKYIYWWSITITLIFNLIYILSMLLAYLFKFSEYEAIRLASWDRYLGIYFVALLAIIVFILIANCNKKKLPISLIVVSVFFIYLGKNNFESNFIDNREKIEQNIVLREPYDIVEKTIKNIVKKNKKRIYMIVQNSLGYEYYLFRYSLQDSVKSINPSFTWSIGKKYYDGDVWTNETYNLETWKKELLEKYDYVYLYKVDEQFIKQFGNLFEDKTSIENNQIYYINMKTNKLHIAE